jgi:hypothetical protein
VWRNRIILLIAFGFFSGCGGNDGSRQAVARVDGQALTLDDVVAQLDTTRGTTRAQVAEYARRWLNDEILYREAVQRGLESDENVLAKLERTRRQLAINALLQQEVYTERSLACTPEEVSRYYAAHQQEFTLSTDVGLISYVVFRDRDAANAFRGAVLRGTPWSEAVRQMVSDPQLGQLVVGRMDSAYVTASTLLPVELWRVTSAATRPEPSFPVSTNEGFTVLIRWKMMCQGQIADLQYVEADIRARLGVERRKSAYDALLEKLRPKHRVELLVSDEADSSSMNYAR